MIKRIRTLCDTKALELVGCLGVQGGVTLGAKGLSSSASAIQSRIGSSCEDADPSIAARKKTRRGAWWVWRELVARKLLRYATGKLYDVCNWKKGDYTLCKNRHSLRSKMCLSGFCVMQGAVWKGNWIGFTPGLQTAQILLAKGPARDLR